jgi:hypothetical protein
MENATGDPIENKIRNARFRTRFTVLLHLAFADENTLLLVA